MILTFFLAFGATMAEGRVGIRFGRKRAKQLEDESHADPLSSTDLVVGHAITTVGAARRTANAAGASRDGVQSTTTFRLN